jgi:hypothetical protein
MNAIQPLATVENREEPTDFRFEENLQGRINNLALSSRSQGNTLIPLFEAISNSIHSIQERFGDEWGKKGDIKIVVIREESDNSTSFEITDNGVGLNDENFKSFCTYDSPYKIKKGGKGVGRLTWLKVFRKTHIHSIYQENGRAFIREFDFELRDPPIYNHKKREARGDQERTIVHLQHLKDGYDATCPKKTEVIAKKVIAHFLPFLIGDDCPAVEISDAEGSIDLRQMLNENKLNTVNDTFDLDGFGKFIISHVLLDRDLVDGKAEHKIYFAAHGRIVYPHVINNQTGLDNFFEHDDRKVAYVGIVSGEYFDANVTQERNNFDIESDIFKQISKASEERAKKYLHAPIAKIIEEKSLKVDQVLTQFPRYKYLVPDSKDFSKDLPLNARTEEDIYREMSVYDFRKTRDISREVKSIVNSKSDPKSQEDCEKIYDQLIARIGQQERSDLAQYIVRRKAIIDLLDTRLGFQDGETEKKYKEDAIHKIICPMQITSQQIEYGQHNLWLIDDRLAFYRFWASDKRILDFIQSSNSEERPDLALFEGSSLLNRENTNQPVVIVEFKRPARKEYSEKENPIRQMFNYIKELREKTVNDSKGRLITNIDKNTPFFCYLVCDMTPKLMDFLNDSEINKPIPGGRGFFGYHATYNAYLEVIQYSEIVRDARLRHEAFFKELGIN